MTQPPRLKNSVANNLYRQSINPHPPHQRSLANLTEEEKEKKKKRKKKEREREIETLIE
jgi:hypothetical protein